MFKGLKRGGGWSTPEYFRVEGPQDLGGLSTEVV